MNNTFSFSRFRKVLRYNLQDTVKKNGAAIVLTPGIVLIFAGLINYCLMMMGINDGGMVLTVHTGLRIVLISATHFIMMLFMASSCFGFITDKRDNIGYLMIPASTLEKMLSIVTIYYIIIPVVIAVAGIAADSILTLIRFGGFRSYLSLAPVTEGFDMIRTIYNGVPMFKGGWLIMSTIIGYLTACSYTLLCSLIFKSHKVLMTIVTYIVISTAASFFGAPIAIKITSEMSATLSHTDDIYVLSESLQHIVNSFFAGGLIVSVIILAGLLTAIYFRLKRIKS